MLPEPNQKHNASLFASLHHNDKILVLPNIWDPLGASLLESLGYPAVATASASISYSNGYADGEQIPFPEMLTIIKKVVRAVRVPVTADIENGYALNLTALAANIKALVDIGISGINIEDRRHSDNEIAPVDEHCERLSMIKQTAEAMGTSLFINARTDIYIKATNLNEEEKLAETIRRGQAYKKAGADCFYPIFLKDAAAIKTVVQEVALPVNILLLPGIPGFDMLKTIGVVRLSLGPAFLKTAINAMKNLAGKLINGEGLEEVMENPVSSTYLQDLIVKR